MERLVGRWVGEGVVQPKGVAYEEELTITAVPTPKGVCFHVYSQTWKAATNRGTPMHMETGLIRQLPGQQLELLLTHPFGLAEVSTGRADGDEYRFESGMFVRTETARPPFVNGFRRSYRLEEGVLRYQMDMRLEGGEYGRHLEAMLTKG